MSPRHRALLPWISLLVIYVVWGSTYLAIRIVVGEMPPFAAAAVRFLVAGLAMGALALRSDRAAGPFPRRAYLDYALVGVLLLSFGNALVMWSEQRIPSGIAALIVGSVPLWLTLLDGLRAGGQPWTLRVWIGTLVGLAGVVLVARPAGGMHRDHLLAVGALQVATLAWTAGSLYSQSVRTRLPLATASAVEMIAGGVVLLGESALLREDWSALLRASGHAWAGLGYLVVFGSLVGFTAYAYCLNELPASTVGTYAYVNPVVAVLLGWAFLGEAVSPGLLLGGALILAAVVLTTRARARGRSAPAAEPPSLAAAETT